MKPNKNFELSIEDIELIENSLRKMDQTREISDLLGKIHNQKNWYRPKSDSYVSG